ncbi:pro41 protein [Dichotomopilus funicola]|uniref:Pro41 protein n=1 Tax=Dichotomopilus funicola TaxID=1934379 RepID=A0AAN6UU31_9PEZI|nr:pro41 protein [Dichotomopilus funicola]
MGRLIKNHWARLVTLTAAAYQVTAAVEAFFWPKILWDFATQSLDKAVKPVPVLQLLNLAMGLAVLAWEWPLHFVAGSRLHRSIAARLVAMPLVALTAALIYQGGDASIYYTIAFLVYLYAYREGEIIPPEPWQIVSRLAARAEAPAQPHDDSP